jgi:integrase
LAVKSDEDVATRTALLEEMAARLKGIIPPEDVLVLLKVTGAAKTTRQLHDASAAVDAVVTGQTSKATSALAPTFAKFAEAWTKGELRKKHPDHVREKDSTRDAQILRDYVNPKIGHLHLPDVTLDAAETVMAALPSTLAPATRKHVAQCMRKVLAYAVYPGRHLTANVLPKEWMPKGLGTKAKAKSCLYPDDDAALVSCVDVALDRRIAYGILDREGFRASELDQLRWRDLDLAHGRVRLDENKTDDPRAWALSSDVVRVLAWWKKRTKGEAGDLVLGGLVLAQGSSWLRGREWKKGQKHKPTIGDLRTAGVTRAELFERSKARQPIRLHDLRATFVTVSLANDKTEQWVSDRTGHKSSAMLALYKRQARTWKELDLGTFRPLDKLLPEMAGASKGSRSGPGGAGRKAGSKRASRPAARRNSGDLGGRKPVKIASRAIDAPPWRLENPRVAGSIPALATERAPSARDTGAGPASALCGVRKYASAASWAPLGLARGWGTFRTRGSGGGRGGRGPAFGGSSGHIHKTRNPAATPATGSLCLSIVT